MDQKENRDNEEYRFKEESPSSSYPNFPGGNKDAMEKMGRQAILGVIGLIFIVFFAYRLISWIFSTEPQKKAATPPPVPPAQVVTAAPPAISPEVEHEIKSRLTQDEQAIAQIQTTLSGVQDQVNTINSSMQNLGAVLKQIQDDVAALKPKPKPQKVKVETPAPKPSYYVKALVPGRAWLNAEGGTILTVSPGDQLPGYGVVSEIDVEQGAILTSTGDIIRFHPGDS